MRDQVAKVVRNLETCRAGGTRETGAPCVPKGLLDFHHSRMAGVEAAKKVAAENVEAKQKADAAKKAEEAEVSRSWKPRMTSATGPRLSTEGASTSKEARSFTTYYLLHTTCFLLRWRRKR